MRNCSLNRCLDAAAVESFLCNRVCNHLRIGGRLENRACNAKLVHKMTLINKVTVMRYCDIALAVPEHQGLSVFSHTLAGG